MQRKFFGNLLILQALNWLVKPLWIFWIDRLAQIQLGDAWYGKYYVIFSFGLLLNILLDFGLNSYVAAQVGKTGNASVAKPIFKLRLWLAALYVLLILALGLIQNFDTDILILAIANQVLAGFVLFFRSVLQGRHFFRTDSIISVTDRLIAIAICGAYLYGAGFNGKTGVLVFLGAQTVGYAIALLTAIFFAYYHQQKQVHEALQTQYASLLRQTAWFATLAFAMSVFTRIDALMIRYLAAGSYAEAGLYAQSFRLLDAALIFSSLISTLLLPLFSGMLSKKEPTDTLVWLNVRIVLFVALPAACVAYFYGSDVLNLLYKNSYTSPAELAKSQAIFFPLMTCFIPMALVHIFGTWLTAAGQVKFLSFLAFGSMGINITLNFFLIPTFGAIGAAWASLLTQGLFALGCIIQSRQQGAFSLPPKRILILFAWLSLSVILFWAISHWQTGILSAGLALLGFVGVTVIIGVFGGEVRRVVSRKGVQ